MNEPRTLSVFLCHASQDKSVVRDLYQRLLGEKWIDPWLDEEKLLPGQDWDLEIEKAVEAADVVLVCLSSHSVSKEGYVQRELKFVLDIALEKPEGMIFVVPLRLDDCLVPRRLRSWQYVDYFPVDQRKRAYQRLTQSLQARRTQLALGANADNVASPREGAKPVAVTVEEKIPPVENKPDHLMVSFPTTTPGILELAASILPILFFAQLAPFLFGKYDETSWALLGVSAILTALILVFKREIIADRWVKYSTILFVIVHGLVIYGEYSGWGIAGSLKILDGIVAVIATGLRIVKFKSPRKSAPYAAIFFAAFLALYGVKLLLNAINEYPNEIQTPMVTVAVIGSIFLWLER